MSGRMLWIEARRTIAVWFLPPMLAVSWLIMRGDQARTTALVWAEASVAVRDSILFAGPVIAGAAAWMAGRERRRGLEELFATTPCPAWSRRVTTLAGTALWGVLAYLVAGASIIVLTARHAVWGAPTLWPMIVGLLALPAHAALGFALGRFLPSRFTAPLVAVALFAVQVYIGFGGVGSTSYPPNSRFDWVAFLSPMARLDTSVWYGVRPNVGLPQALFLLGLTGLALAGLALRERRGPVIWGALAATSLLAAIGVALIIQRTPPGGTVALSLARNVGSGDAQAGLIPYESVCTADPLPVCVHPAFASRLDAYATAINQLAAPLVGIPGAPTRAEQRPSRMSAVVDGALLFQPDWMTVAQDPHFFGIIATSLVHGRAADGRIPPNCPGDPTQRSCLGAQDAIGIWLVQRIDIAPAFFLIRGEQRVPEEFRRDQDGIVAAAERFAALPPAEQQVWLQANYTALREGRVPLSALP